MSTEAKPVMVKLSSIPGKSSDGKVSKSKERSFEISRANELLKMKKSAWKLTDEKFQWNGSEIAPSKK